MLRTITKLIVKYAENWKCAFCGMWNNPGTTACHNCGNGSREQ